MPMPLLHFGAMRYSTWKAKSVNTFLSYRKKPKPLPAQSSKPSCTLQTGRALPSLSVNSFLPSATQPSRSLPLNRSIPSCAGLTAGPSKEANRARAHAQDALLVVLEHIDRLALHAGDQGANFVVEIRLDVQVTPLRAFELIIIDEHDLQQRPVRQGEVRRPLGLPPGVRRALH